VQIKFPILSIFFHGENSQSLYIANKLGQTFCYPLIYANLKEKLAIQLICILARLLVKKTRK